MRWSEIDQQTCSVARTLAVIGDRWSLLVLRDLFLGTRRFEDFCRQLGISRPALTKCLRKLEEHGVLEKRQYQSRPPRSEYHLTAKGLDLYPVMMTMASWGDRWQDDGNGAPIEYLHSSCGHKTRPTMHCSECHEPLHPHEVRPLLGPGLRAATAGQPIPISELQPFLRRAAATAQE
jgi:DNA-binding HxlR family transcriptional regulator